MEATQGLLPQNANQRVLNSTNDITHPLFSSDTREVQHQSINRNTQLTSSRFLGIFGKPLKTFCCGLPLKKVLKISAVILLFWGITRLVTCFASLWFTCGSIFLIPAGILFWRATSTSNPKLSVWGTRCITLAVIIDIIKVTIIICLLTFRSVQDIIVRQLEKEYYKNDKRHTPTTEELHKTVLTFTYVAIGFSLLTTLIEIILWFLLAYIAWSFTTRLRYDGIFFFNCKIYIFSARTLDAHPLVTVNIIQNENNNHPNSLSTGRDNYEVEQVASQELDFRTTEHVAYI